MTTATTTRAATYRDTRRQPHARMNRMKGEPALLTLRMTGRGPDRAPANRPPSGGCLPSLARLGRKAGPHWRLPVPSSAAHVTPPVIYVSGHRNPDTDSIASAIGYAELMRRLDPRHEYVPVRLGDVNTQTRWALDRA